MPTITALRHVGGSGRLLYLDLSAAVLSAMVWGDNVEATRPWRGARTLQSLVLNSSYHHEPIMALMALRALPSLTHLYLPLTVLSNTTLDSFVQHLGPRLTPPSL